MRTLVFGLSLLLWGCVFISCSSDDKVKEEALASIKNEKQPTEETVVLSAGEDATFMGPKTSVEFPKQVYEYGTVKSGDLVVHEFEFTNTGREPLIIKNVSASCGCTAPEWPKEPIAPGEQGKIKAEFNTAGKSGMQNKTITVQSNASQGEITLTLKGTVLKDSDKES